MREVVRTHSGAFNSVLRRMTIEMLATSEYHPQRRQRLASAISFSSRLQMGRPEYTQITHLPDGPAKVLEYMRTSFVTVGGQSPRRGSTTGDRD